MSGLRKKPPGLVADANVLIDYAESDRSMLSLISRHLARIRVPSPVLGEVDQLAESDAVSLGIVVVEPTLNQALEAEAGERPTSFQDRLCLVVARDGGWSVLTNDTALRRVCRDGGIPCVWGMEAMVILVDEGRLSPARAMRVAEGIARSNRFITQSILDGFRKRIGLRS